MQLEVGKIYEGKITRITKFGAFVELEKGTTGMVHISEVANTYVSEIKDHVQEGQTVKVKVLNVGEDGKIGLSIKKALPRPERPQNGGRKNGGGSGGNNSRQGGGQRQGGRQSAPRTYAPRPEPVDLAKNPPPVYDVRTTSGDADFEDMMAKFKATSEERFSDLKHVMDNKRRGTSRRR